MTTERRGYGRDTFLDSMHPWGLFVGGRALCSDGKVRRLHRIAPTADTFYSVPAAVQVYHDGKRRTVSGFVTFETVAGYSTESLDDPAVVKFIAYEYGKNKDTLPRGSWRERNGDHVQP